MQFFFIANKMIDYRELKLPIISTLIIPELNAAIIPIFFFFWRKDRNMVNVNDTAHYIGL